MHSPDFEKFKSSENGHHKNYKSILFIILLLLLIFYFLFLSFSMGLLLSIGIILVAVYISNPEIFARCPSDKKSKVYREILLLWLPFLIVLIPAFLMIYGIDYLEMQLLDWINKQTYVVEKIQIPWYAKLWKVDEIRREAPPAIRFCCSIGRIAIKTGSLGSTLFLFFIILRPFLYLCARVATKHGVITTYCSK